MKVSYVILPDKDKRIQAKGPGEAVAAGKANGDLANISICTADTNIKQ